MVEEVGKQRPTGLSIDVTTQDGNTKNYSVGEANFLGLKLEDVDQENRQYYKYDDPNKGETYTTDVADLPASIALDEETGNIEITAPKSVYESEMFKNAFDEEELKKYSLAYKLNPEHKVSVREANEETGEEEDKEVSIPEYINRLNSAMSNYMRNLRSLHAYKNELRTKYGNKVDNLTDEMLSTALSNSDKAIYLPSILFNIGSFGGKENPFLALKSKLTEDGAVSVDDLMDVYTRSNFGRDDMAALLTTIDEVLRGSEWSAEGEYLDEDGISYKNNGSAAEMAKLLAFRNYIIANNPKGEDYQQMGDWIESFVDNAAYETTKIFGDLAGIAQYAVTGGQDDRILEGVREMDEAMEYFNENNALVWDAVTNAQIWGTVGGLALGTWGTGRLISIPFKILGAASSAYTARYLNVAANIARLADAGEKISLGARIAFRAMTIAEKVNLGINAAVTAISNFKNSHFFVDYIIDTMHDAILYDAVGFKDMMTEMSKQANVDDKAAVALAYWAQQFADNAKFWAPMGVAKAAIKTAGKSTLGKATNIILTKYINKLSSTVGTWFQGKQDDIANGTVIAKLQRKLEEAEANNKIGTANRLKRKITIELQTEQLRKARASLGNVKLDWDGIRLSEKSAEEWKNAMARVKAVENGVDLYIRGVDAETRAMLTPFKDPVTGKRRFLYEELAGANVKASNWYYGLVSLGTKYKLSPAADSLLNQDIIDFWQGTFKRDIYTSFALAGGEKAAQAEAAIPQITENLSAIRQRLPKEIVDYVEDGIKSKTYQDFYKQLNRYGTENKLLVKETVESYEANPIWVENGYMPIARVREANGRWIREDDKIESIVEQEMDKLTFGATPGEHFHDPELVRQVRIRHMAQAKVNAQIWKSYSGFGSDATNVTIVSGESTEFARKAAESQKAFESVVSRQAGAIFETEMAVGLTKVTKKTPKMTMKEALGMKETVVAQMAPDDIEDYLVTKGILPNYGDTLSGQVTREGYDAWYDSQTDAVKKFLADNKQPAQADIEVKVEMSDSAQSGMSDEEFLKQIDELESKEIPRVNYDEFRAMVNDGGDEFEVNLQRAYLLGDKKFGESDIYRGAARNVQDGKEAFYQGALLTKLVGALEKKKTLDAADFMDDMLTTMRTQLETYINATISDPGVKVALESMMGITEGGEDAARYIVLRELLREDNFARANEALESLVDNAAKGKNLGQDDINAVKKASKELFKDVVTTEMAWAQLAARTINPKLGDSKDLAERIKRINDRITAAEKHLGQDYVMYLDDMGRKVYAKVDPAFASLFNYRYRMEKAEASVLARINARMSQAFRLGTTSVNLSSFGNQLFRDFGNALLVGGAWQTVKQNADNLTRVFGQSIVEQIKQFEPEEFKRIESVAEAEGRTVESVAVSRELMKGAAKAPSTTERTLYKTFRKEMRGGDAETALKKMQTKLQGFVDKFNPDDFLNGKRENYLRNRVYASALNDAMKDGYTVEQARALAEFAMNNATTNFTRQLYHFQAIADSTPYFRAAINGTKSFWRMWALDPVGITGRIMGGLVIPTMAITGASLIDEKDREVYMNIPEYQKQNSLVFVFNGQAMSIPIPQEMGQIVAPFRQFVEYLHDSNKNDFWELMMNDLLGFSPIDLQGFSTIDMDKMIADPTLLDRINRGFARVFSQTAPIPLKSAYMLATGTDPYSGKNLRDTSYLVRNEETGELEVMDYNQNAFAQWIASIFGENMSADLAEKIVSGTIGTTGSDVLGSITKLLQEGPEAAAKDLGRAAVEQINNPFDIVEYNYVDAVWKRAIRQLTTEKNAITNSAVWKKLNSELAQTKDETQRKKILAERQDLIDDFNQRVESTITRLGSVYNGTFDRKKFAAVVSLLNFSSDSSYQSGSQYSSSIVSDQFWDSRSASIHTLERMGVTGTNDMSIFGYLATDKDGKVVVKYASPVAIMDIENQWGSQSDVHLANIKALASQNNLWDKHEAMEQQIDAIYSKSKLSDSDYDAIDAIYVNWNAEVMAALAPYVEKMTPEAAINNSQVLDYMDSLIEVPGEYKKDKYGRYVTSSKLGNGSATQAYVRNYIKNIFGINDTSYASGRNYSTRKNYDEENKRWT